jgi:hypothetical protein
MRILFIAVIVVIAFVAAFTLYFFLNSTPTNATIYLTGSSIAQQSTKFFDNMRQTNKQYYSAEDCIGNRGQPTCSIESFYVNDSNSWTMFAYSGLYQATENQVYLQNAKNDAQVLFQDCSINPDNCLWMLVQMIQYQKLTNDNQYSPIISNLGQRLMSNSENDAMMLGIESRELAMLYEMNSQQSYLDEAVSRLQQSQNLWINDTSVDSYERLVYTDNNQPFYGPACWTELAQIELYQATNNQTYLTNARNFFDSVNIDKHASAIDALINLNPCIDSLLKLSTITGNQKYYNQAANATQYLVTYRWDSPLSMAEKYNGDGGFLSNRYYTDNTKFISDATYVVYILSQMNDTQFAIVSWR